MGFSRTDVKSKGGGRALPRVDFGYMHAFKFLPETDVALNLTPPVSVTVAKAIALFV